MLATDFNWLSKPLDAIQGLLGKNLKSCSNIPRYDQTLLSKSLMEESVDEHSNWGIIEMALSISHNGLSAAAQVQRSLCIWHERTLSIWLFIKLEA